MPVEFLSDEQAAAHGRYAGPPSRVELERYFYLDDADKALIARRRGDHNRFGFALQAVTVRFIGTFLTDPLDVPAEVLDYVAEQELAEWIDARAWTTGDGPKAIFDGAVGWLRDGRVLLPGATTLARLVSRVRGAATQRLWETLHALLTPEQRVMLDVLLAVPDGSRVSEWDRLRKGPRKASGPGMVKALNRVSELAGLRLGELDLAVVPPRRVAELARYGLAGKTPALKRHQAERRLATLLASVHHLEHVATDDALELLDLLVVSDLLARAARETNKEKLRRYGSFSRASAKLAAAVEVLLEATGFGEEITLEQLWESIEAVVPRRELADAVAAVTDIARPPDADPDGEWRAELTKRIATVRGFLPLLCEVIAFGATAEGEPALAAMKRLPEALAFRSGKLKAGEIPARMVDEGLVTSEWRRLVFRHDASGKAADRAAYVFCVLEKFHRYLRRRDIYAETSTRWRDPRAQLLDGEAWQRAKGPALTALGLPENPDALLASHARRLDATYREVAGRLVVNTDVRVDADGKLHVAHIEAVPDPASLTDLRDRLQAMLPQVDLPELILEVMAWHPAFTDAFTAVSGGESRLASLNVSVAAVLTAHALNVGYAPIIAPGVPALERDRLSHVDQNYMRAETYKVANASLIEAQAGIGLAQEWGGGLVAAIDGIRFVVPIPTIHARPNPKYWGRRRGAQWINMMNDRFAGTGGIVVAGTPRDSLHAIDVIYSQDGGARPEVIITDTASYTDIVFGLLSLLGFSYRPQLADLPDQKLWRIDAKADYGPLNAAARGRIDLEAIRRHWPDILRIVASIHTCAVRAHDVLRVISRDGHPTPLGNAIAAYGRVFKSLHVLTFIDDADYRRDIKAMRNLQESRHDLGRHVFHGKKGELRQKYHEGMEDQLGALGLVLNCITLWNTTYLDAALADLRASGYPVLADDIARLTPFMRRHINVYLDKLQNRYGPGPAVSRADPDSGGCWRSSNLPAGGNRELPGDGQLGHGLLLNAGLGRS